MLVVLHRFAFNVFVMASVCFGRDLVDVCAQKIHVDVSVIKRTYEQAAVCAYAQLPDSQRQANYEAALFAMTFLYDNPHVSLHAAASQVHLWWLSHHFDRASEIQRLPYDQLPEYEQAKDIVVVLAAASLLNHQFYR